MKPEYRLSYRVFVSTALAAGFSRPNNYRWSDQWRANLLDEWEQGLFARRSLWDLLV